MHWHREGCGGTEASTADLLADLCRVVRRAHDLQVRAWASLALFGVVLLLGVDTLAGVEGRPTRVRCASLPRGWMCHAPRGASGAVHAVVLQGTTTITLGGRAPEAMALGQHWCYWSAAITAVALVVVGLHRRHRTSSPRLLRWYLLVIGGSLAVQIACSASGWSPATAGVLGVAWALGTSAAAERDPTVLGAATVVLASVVVVRHLPAMAPLRTVLPAASAVRLAVGIALVAVAGVLRWRHTRRDPRDGQPDASPLSHAMGE
jgi:hypothetical protein